MNLSIPTPQQAQAAVDQAFEATLNELLECAVKAFTAHPTLPCKIPLTKSVWNEVLRGMRDTPITRSRTALEWAATRFELKLLLGGWSADVRVIGVWWPFTPKFVVTRMDPNWA